MKSAAKTKAAARRPKVVLQKATYDEILENVGVTKADMRRAVSALKRSGWKPKNPELLKMPK